MRYKHLLTVLLTLGVLACLAPTSYGQQATVQGTVTDSQGESLPGVNITVKGTTRGTTTDSTGFYKLSVNPIDTLVFSFVGFQRRVIPVNDRNTINVTLSPSTLQSEELVVVGYGTQRKKDLTGSISSVDSAEVTSQPALTATDALQGKVPGVNIIKNDAPGATPTVIMRGLGTALGGRNPLYIVDGVPTDNINNIAPSDIKSIDFLKDAAAASIYGVRAANGVIIVTTKQGMGKPEFNVKAYTGYNTVLNRVKMANADQYITYSNEENAQRKKYLNATDTYQLAQDQKYNTNWFDALLEPGYVVNATASIGGKSGDINYYFSYNLNKHKGILDNQDFWRQTLRSNNKFHLFNDFLEVDQTLNVSFSQEHPQPFSAFTTAFTQSPLVPTFYPNGRYGQPFVNTTTGVVTYQGNAGDKIGRLNNRGNPLATIAFNHRKSNTVELQGKVSAIFKLTDYLTFTSRLGGHKYYNDNRTYNPIEQRWIANDPTRTASQYQTNKEANPGATGWANNSLYIANTQTLRWNWDNFLNFSKSFDRHNLNVTLGMSSEKDGSGQTFNGTAYDVPQKEQYWNLDFGSDQYDKVVNQHHFTPSTLLSYFGRVQYNYDQRYYISGTLRRDGSSIFKNTGDYYDYFPSVAVGWNITNEEFMSDNDFFDHLKLRASWGKLGNQNVPLNTTQIETSTGSSSQNYVFGPDQTLRFGAYVGSPARNLSWEIVKEWNAGADIIVFDNRLTTNIDLYQKTTENVILQVNPIPDSQFEGSFFDHGGEVVNKGLEISMDWSDDITSDFSYNIGVNFSYNHNEVTHVRPAYEGETGGSLNNGQITKRLADHQPLGAWWMYEAIGVWQSQEQIDNNPSIGGAQPGFLRYKDQNGDGVIDERDKKYFGSYVPTYNYGIKVGLNYKQFDFSLDAFGAGGNKVYNGLTSQRWGGENVSEYVFNHRWTGPNSTNTDPAAFRDHLPSNYYLEDGSYLRINNITLGYSLNMAKMFSHVRKVRFYVSAQNPFLFTGYTGFTPELQGNQNGDPYGTSGIELAAYPNTRTLLFGINLDFK